MKEMIEKLTKLIQENPDLPVKMLVDSETLCDPSDYSYTNHKIKSVELSKWHYNNGGLRVYTDINDIVEHMMDTYDIDESKATQRAMENSYEVILIKTEAVW